MELVRPHLGEAKGRTDDWLEVSAWMQENDKDITDLETLGTSDPRRKLREVR
jgi:hypothetical protein